MYLNFLLLNCSQFMCVITDVLVFCFHLTLMIVKSSLFSVGRPSVLLLQTSVNDLRSTTFKLLQLICIRKLLQLLDFANLISSSTTKIRRGNGYSGIYLSLFDFSHSLSELQQSRLFCSLIHRQMLLVAAYNSCSSLALVLVVLLPESEKDADLVSVQLQAAVKSITLRLILEDI